jgi:hypothetical protein
MEGGKMKITMSEQILRGNFGGSDDEQTAAADKYAELLQERLTDFCNKIYPDAELKFNLHVDNASGCGSGFSVWIDNADHDIEFDIEQAIKNEFDGIVYQMDKSGEIYE